MRPSRDHGPRTTVGGADRSGSEQCGHTGVELCQRVELVAARANGLGIGVLIDELPVYASLVFSTRGGSHRQSYTLHTQRDCR